MFFIILLAPFWWRSNTYHSNFQSFVCTLLVFLFIYFLKIYSDVVWSKFLSSFCTKCLKQTFRLESHALQFMEILSYLFGNYSTPFFSENHSLSKTSIVSMLAFWNEPFILFSFLSYFSFLFNHILLAERFFSILSFNTFIAFSIWISHF